MLEVRPVTVTGDDAPVASDQFDPPSVENWYFEIEPDGAVNETDNFVPSAATPVAAALVGAAAAVYLVVAPLAAPLPTEFTARINTEYDVLDTRARLVSDLSVIVRGEVVPVVLRAFQLVPPSVEYCQVPCAGVEALPVMAMPRKV